MKKTIIIILILVAFLIYFDLKSGSYIRYYILGEGMPPGYCDPGPCL